MTDCNCPKCVHGRGPSQPAFIPVGEELLEVLDAHPPDLALADATESSNVRGLPVPEPERYVTRAELAEIMGVSVPTIDRMVAEGMPSETWGRRARRFRPSVAIAWARTQRRAA